MGIFRNRPSVGLGDNPGDAAPGRHSWYGDLYSVPVGNGRHNAADEGSYFTAVNPTLATVITGHVAPAIADGATKPIIHIYNGGPRHVAIDYIKLAVGTVNASSTSTDFLTYLSNDGVSSRASGGAAVTPANCRSDAPNSSGAVVYVGAVIAAPVSAVKTSQWTVRSVIAVTEDQYEFHFGNGAFSYATGVTTGTTVNKVACTCPPVVIAPGGNFHFVQIGPSGAATAMTFEFELGYWER